MSAPDGRAFATAVDAVLAPLGCRQRGHSLTWIADYGYWLAIAKFDEARGHASVGGHFLWFVQSRFVFDFGTRFPCDFERPQEMARQAAEALAADRAKFANIAAIARHFAAADDDEPWPLYHAGVASGLAGDADAARGVLARLAARPALRDWEIELKAAAQTLAACRDVAGFRETVAAAIAKTRALQGWPPLTDPLA